MLKCVREMLRMRGSAKPSVKVSMIVPGGERAPPSL
jgi:hypothetical protein